MRRYSEVDTHAKSPYADRLEIELFGERLDRSSLDELSEIYNQIRPKNQIYFLFLDRLRKTKLGMVEKKLGEESALIAVLGSLDLIKDEPEKITERFYTLVGSDNSELKKVCKQSKLTPFQFIDGLRSIEAYEKEILPKIADRMLSKGILRWRQEYGNIGEKH